MGERGGREICRCGERDAGVMGGEGGGAGVMGG